MFIKLKHSMAVTFVLLLAFVSSAYSQLGIRAGSYTDLDEIFIGGEYLAPLSSQTYLNPNIEYVFLDNATFLSFNMDLHYDFYHSGTAFMWAGGGLGMQYLDYDRIDDSSTEAGVNLLFGLGFETHSNIIPYVQGKVILGEYDDFVLGIGLRF